MPSHNRSLDFQPPASHRTDPVTSFEAEHEVTVTGARQRQADACVLLVETFPGSTAKELWEAWDSGWWRLVGLPKGLISSRYAISRRLGSDCRDRMGAVQEGEPRLARLPGATRREVTWWPR